MRVMIIALFIALLTMASGFYPSVVQESLAYSSDHQSTLCDLLFPQGNDDDQGEDEENEDQGEDEQ